MSVIHSMTGFSSTEGEAAGHRLRIEIKTLNHRHLDIKTRLPREFSSAEMPLRAAITARLNRGALELRVERLDDPSGDDDTPKLDLARATHYYESILALQKSLGLNDPIRTIDIASLPEVFSRAQAEESIQNAWKELEPLVDRAITQLTEMRAHEGASLERILTAALDELQSQLATIRSRRTEWEAISRKKLTERVQAAFEAHPIQSLSTQAILESRIAQELALILDRSDVEEELVRFQGHIDHFRKVLTTGGPVGRKLDFILQELNREINTLNNKAQDFQISEQAVQMKVRIEQIREQVMNLE